MSNKKKGEQPITNAKVEALLALRKRIAMASKPDAEKMPEACIVDIVTLYPTLHLLMMAHLVDNGPEQGASLTLWGKEAGLGGILNVRPFGVKAFIDAQSLQEWLQEAERLLDDPSTKWHREGRSRGRSRGRGKQGREWS